MYKTILDRVTAFFTDDRFMSELTDAKETYFRRTGKVFEDEPIFEIRMTSFLEWYLFDRFLKDFGVPPIRLFRNMFEETLSKEESENLYGLEKGNHSLFLYVDRQGERFKVRDLFDDSEFEVQERRKYGGIEKGDILDGRILKIGDRTLFSDALWFYPHAAREFILTECKKRRGQGREDFDDLLFDLAYMKLKQDRYKHVATEQIYDWAALRRDRVEMERRNA